MSPGAVSAASVAANGREWINDLRVELLAPAAELVEAASSRARRERVGGPKSSRRGIAATTLRLPPDHMDVRVEEHA